MASLSLGRELAELLEQTDVLLVLVGRGILGELIGKCFANTTLLQKIKQDVVQLLNE